MAQERDSTQQKPQLDTSPPAVPAQPQAPVTQPNRPVPPPQPQPEPEPEEKEEPVTERPSIREKLFIGGSGDLGFSSNSYYGNFFNIGASPILGYRITKRFALGPGIVYNYYNLGGRSFSDYGAKAFTQVILYKAFFLHAEHQILNTQGYDSSGRITPDSRQNIQSTLAGAGYRQMASDRFGFDLYLLFNIANSNGVRNSRPILRAGFIYNLK
ncbi:hypothetical protein AAE02nite_13570 [Adhaeribacter aerolatus]|uniref:Outer membrane protein beta-barrel domain-containing protein n=1 Tax=Adhaeribacter aerolatus TaxID=670289 RepID=A0A512AVI0_9BACT|nr:hypothetical protein AAE02nite_13570 [Adhaeribacter aerolatus]